MKYFTIFFVLALATIVESSCWASPAENASTTRYDTSNLSKTEAASSPKSPWGDFAIVDEPERQEDPWWMQTLLWIPNRVLDLIDVFRVDVGFGPSFGAVLRITKYAQVGYRSVSPFSFRVGDFGRDNPILIENSSEFGISPAYVESKNREICAGELGLGADLFVAGLYGGVCVDELADFIAGIFFFDLKDDDLHS